MELTCPAGFYQLDGILESRKPVEVVMKCLTNQRVGRCMVLTLASMDLYEQLIALLVDNEPH
jgi:hypothetical protein